VVPGETIIEGIHAEGPIIRTRGGLPESSDKDFDSLLDEMSDGAL
jgi:hypothetical protein